MTDNEQENASRSMGKDGKQYHIQCGKGDVTRYCLLPGDPERVGKIVRMRDSDHLMADYKGHTTYTGKIGDMDVSACSTGVGGGSTTSALEDLAEVGYHILIRVGIYGAIQTYIKPDDLVICTRAVRKEGTSDGYVTNSYPAMANHEVTMVLIEAAEQLGYTYHVGIRHTASSFFCGQGRPGYSGYSQSLMKTLLSDMQAAGVLNFEMEVATVLATSSLYKMRAGTIFTVVTNRVENSSQYDNSTVDHNLEVANLVMQFLWERDKKEKERGKAHIPLSLIKQYAVKPHLPR